MTDTDNEATAALDSIRRSQADVADRISRGGWGYDLTYSALLAFMVGGWALKMPVSISITTIGVAGLTVLATTWAKRNGVWINGTTPPRARWVAIGLGMVMIPLMIVNMLWADRGITWPLWVPFIVTAGAFALGLAGSRLWRSVYRREMGLN